MLLIGSIERAVTSLYKNLVKKLKILTSEGRRFRSLFFLRLKQILKAVLIGVVSSIDFLVKHGQPSHTRAEGRVACWGGENGDVNWANSGREGPG
jgi:hypothetical protein